MKIKIIIKILFHSDIWEAKKKEIIKSRSKKIYDKSSTSNARCNGIIPLSFISSHYFYFFYYFCYYYYFIFNVIQKLINK